MNSTEEKKFRGDLSFLLSYIISGARGCVDEPKSYGPVRLVDSASRLIALMNRYRLSGEYLEEIAKWRIRTSSLL